MIDTGPQRTTTPTRDNSRADARDSTEMALAQTLIGWTSIAVGAVGLALALATGAEPEQHAAYDAGLTGIMLSGGLSITWGVLRCSRLLYRQSRREHAEVMHGFETSGQRYDQLTEYIADFTKAQERGAEVIGDVLQRRRGERN